MTDQTNPSDAHEHRAAYIRGLRLLANLLEDRPEIPLPYEGSSADVGHTLSVFVSRHGDDLRGFATLVDKLQDCTERHDPTRAHYNYFARGRLAGLCIEVAARAEDVATQVKVGTETVDKLEWRRPKPEQLDRLLAAVEASPTSAELAEQQGGAQ